MNSTKKRILPAQYALATSGANAGNIGWINFGEEFTILNNQGPISVVNKLKNGYFVSFDIYLNVTTESTIIDEVGYISSVIPTYSDAPFGNTAYTSIGGYSALMLNSNWPISDVIHTTITIENIAVKDCCLNPVKNFTFYVADAETTNKGVTSEAEVWTVQTTPNIWNMVEHMQNVSGTDEGPTISGVGTNTFIEQGIETSNKVTSAYVVSTITPQTINASATIDGGREGFAFGISLDSTCEIKEYREASLEYSLTQCTNQLSPCTIHNFELVGTPVGILNGTEYYKYTGETITLTGNVAVYHWGQDYVTVTTGIENCAPLEDAFVLIYICGGNVVYQTVIFSNY